jgi:tRNA(Ile2) C34 agmatinyltransferase TiaS
MGNKGPICPDCGKSMVLALPPRDKGQRPYQCFQCDRPDPLKTNQIDGRIKASLKPPE